MFLIEEIKYLYKKLDTYIRHIIDNHIDIPFHPVIEEIK